MQKRGNREWRGIMLCATGAPCPMCIKPGGQSTVKQVATIDRLKWVPSHFPVVRGLAVRFRGIPRGGHASRPQGWLSDAFVSGIHWMRQFVVISKRNIDAVRNADSDPWINGQAERQISKLEHSQKGEVWTCGPMCCALGCGHSIPESVGPSDGNTQLSA